MGVVVGHNCEVYVYSPASGVYTEAECAQIHESITRSIGLDVEFKEDMLYSVLEEYGMKVVRIDDETW